MAYLDVSPMMTSLCTAPEDFEVKEGWLHHIPSRHDFKFDSEGNVHLRAQCDCAQLAVQAEHGRELAGAYHQWEAHYWCPLMINREFASHFRRSPLRQLLIDVTAWLHRRLMQQPHAHAPSGRVTALHPAE
jgi:hypothetical protein